MGKKLYQVASGETLKSIATDRLGDVTRWTELAYINSIDSPYFVKPGTIILVPDESAPPMEILVTKGTDRPAAEPAPLLPPAEWKWFAAGAVLILWLAMR